MTRPLVLSIVLLAASAAVLWIFLRTPAGGDPVRGSPLAPATAVGTTAGVESVTSTDRRTAGRVDTAPSATEHPSAPVAATPVAGPVGTPVDDARFLSTVDALFERSFRGPVDQRDAIRLLDTALAVLDPATGREQEDGSWHFDLATSDAKNHVMLEASRFPDGSVRNMKLRVFRPEAPGFSGSPSDVASGDLTLSLTARKGAPPRFSVSARTQFRPGDTGVWNSYRGLSPVGMGGSTDFDATGASWTETTAQATDLDGAPAWNWTNGQTSSVAGGTDAVQIDRVVGSLGAVLPR